MASIVNGNITYNTITFINFEISSFISVIAIKVAGSANSPNKAICILEIRLLPVLLNISDINISVINVSPIFKIMYIIPTLNIFLNAFTAYSPISAFVFYCLH